MAQAADFCTSIDSQHLRALLRLIETSSSDDASLTRSLGETLVHEREMASALALAEAVNPYSKVVTELEGAGWAARMYLDDDVVASSWGMKTECRAILACLVTSMTAS